MCHPILPNVKASARTKDRAYVVVKVANAADSQRREAVIRPKEVRYLNRADESLVIAEVTRPTLHERAAIEVYLTLEECGNLDHRRQAAI